MPSPPRTPIAIVVGVASPYRVQLHQRVVRELPEVELTTVLLHELSIQSWGEQESEEIRPVQFGKGEGVVFSMTPARAWREWQKGRAICEELDRRGVRAVVVNGWNNPALHRVLGWARARGVKSMLWADGTHRSDRSRGVRRLAKRAIARRAITLADMAMTTGTQGERFMRDLGARRVGRFPYEPDVQLIRGVTPTECTRALEELGLDPARRRIVCSGRIAPGRGWEAAIRAFARVAPRRPEWDLVFLGAGDAEQELRLLVPPELRERIRWCGFIANQRTLACAYRASEVLLHPGEREPWGVPVHEALAAGMAVVVGDGVGCAPDLVREGENGLVFPSGNVEQLEACLLSITEPERLGVLRRNAGPVLREWYDSNDPVKGLYEALGDLGVLQTDPARARQIASARGQLVAG